MASRSKPVPSAPSDTASLYIRLSAQADAENLSKDGMIADCKALASRLGKTVIAVHVDDGISGAIRNRPEFMAWLADAKECRADTLIAWHVDRMTREGVNVAAMILDAIEGKDPVTGKVVRAPARLLDCKGLDSEGDDTSFRFRFVIAAEIARGERARMKDRTSAAKDRMRRAGRWSGGPVPYGFRPVRNSNGEGTVLDIEPDEAAFVREAAARLLAGETMPAIVRWANGVDGIPPRRAKAWSRTSLMQILTGNAVAGRVATSRSGEEVPVLDDSGNPVTRPAILTPDESAAVRQALTPKATRTGGRQPARLLSGLLTCHSCQHRLRVERKNTGYVGYRCGTPAIWPGTCAHPVGIAAPALEEYVERVFLKRVGAQPYVVRRAEVTGAAAVERAEAAVNEALQALAHSATPEAFTALQQAQALREEALAVPQESTVRLVQTGRTIAEQWETLDLPERRALLAANLSIVVRPGRQGRRGVQPDRLLWITNPAFAATDPATDYRPLRVVAPVDDLAEWEGLSA